MAKNDDLFLPELEAARRLKPASGAIVLLLAIGLLFAFLIVYSAFAKIDERTRGQGQVMPSSDVQVVQSLEGGIVTDILAREGDVVKKDQILMRIDDVMFAAEEGGLEARLQGLQIKRERLLAETREQEPQFSDELAEVASKRVDNEMALYQSRQQELQTALERIEDEKNEILSNIAEVDASISKYSQTRGLVAKELEIAKKLVAQKAMPQIEEIRLERQYAEASGDLATAQKAKASLQARLSGVEKKRQERKSAFKSDALAQLSDVETQLRTYEESMKSAEDRVARTELRAPVDGIVQSLAVKTVGGVVQPAQKLIDIVPLEDDLLIRARIAPSDVAFLKYGQPVKVGITAYDSMIYGQLDGTLERISADTVEDKDGGRFFEIDVRTDKNYLGDSDNPLRITTGMEANVQIITGKRTILTYIMKPILRARQNALIER